MKVTSVKMAGGKAKTGRQNGEKKMGWKEVKELRKPVNGLFYIEKIQRKWVGKNGDIFYYVRWWGYPKTYNTWEPPSSFTDCPEVIDEFEQSRELLASKRKNRSGLKKIPRRVYARSRVEKGDNVMKLCFENTEVSEKYSSVTENLIAELEEAPGHVEVMTEVDIQPESRELLASKRKNRGGRKKIPRRVYAKSRVEKGDNLMKLCFENTEVSGKESSVTENLIAELEEAPDHVEVITEVDVQPEVIDEFEQSRELLASKRKNRGGRKKIPRRVYARSRVEKGDNLMKLCVKNTEVSEKDSSVTENVIAELEEAPDLMEVDIQPALEEHVDEGVDSDSSSLVILQTESISVEHYQKIVRRGSDVWNNENMEIPTLEPAPSLEDEHSISSADTETMEIPILVLEQSPVDDQYIRILKTEEIGARQKMSPKFIGTAVIKSKVHYIATCEDDGCTASITSNLALKFFPQNVVDLLNKIPIRMHIDQQRFLIQPTSPGNLLCDNCLMELEYQ
ncbi:unnamed protein product [Allacma fusca]|uniref:Chromo domain-containing protein n=1 Tax=Allacma fusca TaxID=39272 RepID=A0A8J2PJG8_9HEXA|nr:unnamed protein product [Allacma fusca]